MFKTMLKILLVVSCSLGVVSVQAWNHGISLGYGYGHEVDYDYYNSGFLLNAKLYKFSKIDRTLIFTIDADLGQWHAHTNQHKELTTLALSGAFRAYFYPPPQHEFVPYLLLSFGPAYLSNTHFGEQRQGANLSFQTKLGAGSEFVINQHRFDVNLHLVHYCNAGIFKPNQGFNILFVGSIGYLF